MRGREGVVADGGGGGGGGGGTVFPSSNSFSLQANTTRGMFPPTVALRSPSPLSSPRKASKFSFAQGGLSQLGFRPVGGTGPTSLSSRSGEPSPLMSPKSSLSSSSSMLSPRGPGMFPGRHGRRHSVTDMLSGGGQPPLSPRKAGLFAFPRLPPSESRSGLSNSRQGVGVGVGGAGGVGVGGTAGVFGFMRRPSSAQHRRSMSALSDGQAESSSVDRYTAATVAAMEADNAARAAAAAAAGGGGVAAGREGEVRGSAGAEVEAGRRTHYYPPHHHRPSASDASSSSLNLPSPLGVHWSSSHSPSSSAGLPPRGSHPFGMPPLAPSPSDAHHSYPTFSPSGTPTGLQQQQHRRAGSATPPYVPLPRMLRKTRTPPVSMEWAVPKAGKPHSGGGPADVDDQLSLAQQTASPEQVPGRPSRLRSAAAGLLMPKSRSHAASLSPLSVMRPSISPGNAGGAPLIPAKQPSLALPLPAHAAASSRSSRDSGLGGGCAPPPLTAPARGNNLSEGKGRAAAGGRGGGESGKAGWLWSRPAVQLQMPPRRGKGQGGSPEGSSSAGTPAVQAGEGAREAGSVAVETGDCSVEATQKGQSCASAEADAAGAAGSGGSSGGGVGSAGPAAVRCNGGTGTSRDPTAALSPLSAAAAVVCGMAGARKDQDPTAHKHGDILSGAAADSGSAPGSVPVSECVPESNLPDAGAQYSTDRPSSITVPPTASSSDALLPPHLAPADVSAPVRGPPDGGLQVASPPTTVGDSNPLLQEQRQQQVMKRGAAHSLLEARSQRSGSEKLLSGRFGSPITPDDSSALSPSTSATTIPARVMAHGSSSSSSSRRPITPDLQVPVNGSVPAVDPGPRPTSSPSRHFYFLRSKSGSGNSNGGSSSSMAAGLSRLIGSMGGGNEERSRKHRRTVSVSEVALQGISSLGERGEGRGGGGGRGGEEDEAEEGGKGRMSRAKTAPWAVERGGRGSMDEV